MKYKMIALCDNDEEDYCKYTHDDVIELASENLGSFTYIFEGQKTMSTSTAFTFTIDRVNIPEDYFSRFPIQNEDHSISISFKSFYNLKETPTGNTYVVFEGERKGRYSGSYKDMDCDEEDTSDLTYVDGNQLDNRRIAYPFSFSSKFREDLFKVNQELYKKEIADVIDAINENDNNNLSSNNLVVCENNECSYTRCIIPITDADLDHDPPLSKRFNDGDYCKDRDKRKESFFDKTRIFIMHKSCNRSKGGEPYNEDKIRQIYEKEYM